jgi:hypothetical protein
LGANEVGKDKSKLKTIADRWQLLARNEFLGVAITGFQPRNIIERHKAYQALSAIAGQHFWAVLSKISRRAYYQPPLVFAPDLWSNLTSSPNEQRAATCSGT